MKLIGGMRSPYCRKVMIVGHELGLASSIERVSASVAATRHDPMVLAWNPLGKIPVLLADDGRAVYDSLVICLELDRLAGGGVAVPGEAKAMVQALQWHALGQGMCDVMLQWSRERARPAHRRTEGYADVLRDKITSAVAAADRDGRDLIAAPFHLGHAALAASLGYLDFRFAELDWRAGHPVLTEWFAGAARRPSFLLTQPD